MILYEYEGKKLLSNYSIPVPKSQLLTSAKDAVSITTPAVAKAQVLSGKRADSGGIIFIDKPESFSEVLEKIFSSKINNEPVKAILVEEKVNFQNEYYLSISYNTRTRSPILTFSSEGGSGIEERSAKVLTINPLTQELQDQSVLKSEKLVALSQELIKLFFAEDCLLLEINPLVEASNGNFFALDAKIKLDDNAAARHPNWSEYPERSAPGHTPTQREIEAKKIDEGDYRGVAGSAFFDLPGDIAIMASGGGASLLALDSLIAAGGAPANYTEYGGNPPREKVAKLTQVVLSNPNINGLWVVGALANFTDIYETLSGFIEGLSLDEASLGRKFDFPIVIRRAGPRDDEARRMLNQVRDFDLHLYGEEISIPESAKIITELAAKYKESKK